LADRERKCKGRQPKNNQTTTVAIDTVLKTPKGSAILKGDGPMHTYGIEKSQKNAKQRTRRRVVLRIATPLLLLAASTSILVSTSVAAEKEIKFTLTDTGQGRIAGVDFAAKGTLNAGDFGTFISEVSSDSLSVKFGAPENGDITMTSRGVSILTSGADRIYAVERGSYKFKLGKLPDGSPGPDLSKDVVANVKVTITGGTGRFANATGTMTQEGTISPSPEPPTGPIANVSYNFKGEGSIIPNSGGSSIPPRVSYTAAERATLAKAAKPFPSQSGAVAPGVYTVSFPNWLVTLNVGPGWRSNGLAADSLGMSTGALSAPGVNGLILMESPLVTNDALRPSSAAPLRANPRDWLLNLAGVSVGETIPIEAGAPGQSVLFSYKAPTADATVMFPFFVRGLNTLAPFFTGQSADLQTFDSPGGDRLIVSDAGGLDPRRTLDAMVVLVERR
jgi:hypothetical protein